MSRDDDRPLPEPTHESKPYWDALSQGRLVLQQCAACGKVRHYPRPVCDDCYAMETTWLEATGRGRVYSFTVTHHPFHPGFKSEVPYILVTVELDEGVRMNAPLRATAPHAVQIGMPVRIVFERVRDDLTLPAFVSDPPPPFPTSDAQAGKVGGEREPLR
jgi:uncharacterized protein